MTTAYKIVRILALTITISCAFAYFVDDANANDIVPPINELVNPYNLSIDYGNGQQCLEMKELTPRMMKYVEDQQSFILMLVMFSPEFAMHRSKKDVDKLTITRTVNTLTDGKGYSGHEVSVIRDYVTSLVAFMRSPNATYDMDEVYGDCAPIAWGSVTSETGH